jgi:hypothetical protein
VVVGAVLNMEKWGVGVLHPGVGSMSWNDELLYNSIPTNIKQYYNEYHNSDVDNGSSWRLEESL